MSDIARRLNLSRLTVSAVLNGRHEAVGISNETAQRVREAATRYGYFRNHLALATRTGQNMVIGCIVSAMSAEWVARTLSGFLAGARVSGYLTKIEEVWGPEEEEAALGRLMEQRVAGLFCCNFNPHEDFIERLTQTARTYEVPVVSSLSRQELPGSHVNSTDVEGCRIAVNHLRSLKHRRIAYLGGSPTELAGKRRLEGFIDAMQKSGIKPNPDLIANTGWSPTRAAEDIRAMLALGPKAPTAVLCANDELAAVSIREARAAGLDVPADFSVIGFSNSVLARFTDPPLTSVGERFKDMGRRSAEILVELVRAGKRARNTDELIEIEFMQRQSTGPAPRHRE